MSATRSRCQGIYRRVHSHLCVTVALVVFTLCGYAHANQFTFANTEIGDPTLHLGGCGFLSGGQTSSTCSLDGSHASANALSGDMDVSSIGAAARVPRASIGSTIFLNGDPNATGFDPNALAILSANVKGAFTGPGPSDSTLQLYITFHQFGQLQSYAFEVAANDDGSDAQPFKCTFTSVGKLCEQSDGTSAFSLSIELPTDGTAIQFQWLLDLGGQGSFSDPMVLTLPNGVTCDCDGFLSQSAPAQPPSAVPEPSSLCLFVPGLLGASALLRRRARC